MTNRRPFLAAFTLIAAATTFLGFHVVPDAATEGAQPKPHNLVVINGVGPGATPGFIDVQVRAKNVAWSGPILYHKGSPFFSSPKRTYTVRVTWRNQTIQGEFKCNSPGLMELHVVRNPKNKLQFVPSQK